MIFSAFVTSKSELKWLKYMNYVPVEIPTFDCFLFIFVLLCSFNRQKMYHDSWYSYEVGSTYLAVNVILHNVLHVPHFQFNNLSISKLCHQLNSLVVFSDKFCFLLQGLSLKRPLVLGRHQAGLYFMHSNENNTFCYRKHSFRPLYYFFQFCL